MAPVKREKSEESAQPDNQHHPPNKRSKHHDFGVGGFTVSQMEINPLDEPSPLGLRLRKTPSLLDLIQMRLSEGNASSKADMHSTKDHKNTSAADKLKASNFPASLLKIGTWEYTSKHEGDLVAKCYFAKHKLVWEVLDGGLKNKIEIQWSDIMGLKATYPDDGPGTLDILLTRQPLFFRETNPQPRKHTLWQATSDFTNGQATLHRRHCLECPHGLLGKHYEKLIQCDPRLSFLSQKTDIALASPYFESKKSVFNKGPATVDLHGTTKSTSGGQSCSSRSELGVESSISMSDMVNHEQEEGSLVILEDISRCLFNDAQSGLSGCDEKSIMSRVNSLCCLLEKDVEGESGSGSESESEGKNGKSGDDEKKKKKMMSRSDSVGELLMNLPRIASLPRFIWE